MSIFSFYFELCQRPRRPAGALPRVSPYRTWMSQMQVSFHFSPG